MVELLITDLSNSGEGVGRFENKIYFVTGAVPGDKVLIRVLRAKKNFSVAEIIEIKEPSPFRIQPQCPHFGICGGCDWQSLSTTDQREWKTKNLRQTLKRIGGISTPNIQPILFGSKEYFYRNRIRGIIKNGQFHFSKKKSAKKIHIEQCHIALEEINQVLLGSEIKNHSGPVEIGVLKEKTYILPVNSERTTEAGFRQVNSEMIDPMMEFLFSIVDSNCDHILELYCGSGTWTRPLAKKFPNINVVGVDINSANIKKARESKNPANLKFILGDAKENWPCEVQSHVHLLVDPPRAGLSEAVIELIKEKRPTTLSYISCHPATLARDLSSLLKQGYTLEATQPIDMFPQTRHLETIVTMRYIYGTSIQNP